MRIIYYIIILYNIFQLFNLINTISLDEKISTNNMSMGTEYIKSSLRGIDYTFIIIPIENAQKHKLKKMYFHGRH